MAFDWTTVAVAIVTGSVGVVGGIYSTRKGADTAEKQMDHDFNLRRDERRAGVYVDLIEQVSSYLVLATRTFPRAYADMGPPPPLPGEGYALNLSARLSAFGSAEVFGLAEVWSSKQVVFSGWVGTVRRETAGGMSAPHFPELELARSELADATKAIRNQVAVELSPPTLPATNPKVPRILL
jgi:hypothetical protein